MWLSEIQPIISYRRHLAACSTPSHFLNQWWQFVIWTIWNKFQWSLNENVIIFISKCILKNVCKMSSFCSTKSSQRPHRPQLYWRSSKKTTYNAASDSSHPCRLEKQPGGRTSYRKISWSFEATRYEFRLFPSLWNLTSSSAATLPKCLSNFGAIRSLNHPISRLRDFTRPCGKTSYRLVNRGPGTHAIRLTCNWFQGLTSSLHQR